jgi:hypothetical protein
MVSLSREGALSVDVGADVSAPRGSVLPGWLAFTAALPLAASIHALTRSVDRPERALILAGALFALLAPIPAAAYLALQRARVVPGRLAVVVLATVVTLATATTLFWISGQVFYPADVLIWSESDFVNDILKLRVGYPLYTSQLNNDSFVYTPGAQILTWLLSSLVGQGDSVVAYRVVQVGFTLAAAGFGMLCCRSLLLVARGRDAVTDMRLWSAVWLPALFLVASNSLTNPFVQNLHNDSLAQLIAVVGFWLLLRYTLSPSTWVLVAMAVLPGVSFLVKQSLIIWGPLYVAYFLFLDRPRSWRRIIGFGAASLATLIAVVAGCFAVFGPEFKYWTFDVLAKHSVSPLRSVQHVLDVWIYFAIGIAGGLVLLRGAKARVLIGPFLAWLVLLSIEAYSSGIAYMLNHAEPHGTGLPHCGDLVLRGGGGRVARSGRRPHASTHRAVGASRRARRLRSSPLVRARRGAPAAAFGSEGRVSLPQRDRARVRGRRFAHCTSRCGHLDLRQGWRRDEGSRSDHRRARLLRDRRLLGHDPASRREALLQDSRAQLPRAELVVRRQELESLQRHPRRDAAQLPGSPYDRRRQRSVARADALSVR